MAMRGRPFAEGNPGGVGRKALPVEFRTRCKGLVDNHVLDAWENEIVSRGDQWVRCSELAAGYAYGKPAQPVTGADGEGGVEVVVRVEYVEAKK